VKEIKSFIGDKNKENNMNTANAMVVRISLLAILGLTGCSMSIAALPLTSTATPVSALAPTATSVSTPSRALEGNKGAFAPGQNAAQPTGNPSTTGSPGQGSAQPGSNSPPNPSSNSGAVVAAQVGLILNTTRAFSGYTLFAPKHNTATYLINNSGQVVHSWTASKYEPGQSAYLLENGNLLRTSMTKGRLSTGGGEGGRVEEYDWNGNLIWELDYSTDQYMQHHDIHPLPNGNVLMLAVEKKTYDQAIAAGFSSSKLENEVKRTGVILPDSVVEIKPTYPSGGQVVWAWHVWDHLIQDLDKTKSNYGSVAAHPELIQADDEGRSVPSFWNHMNSIDYNSTLDQILLSVRGSSEVWIIDHSTTMSEAASHAGGKRAKGGDLLYRWGNPSTFDSGTRDSQTFFQQHDAEWIASGYPGAGNIIVFNNGLGRNYSTIDEFTPPVDAKGNYSMVPGQPLGPKSMAWTYKANPPQSLFSDAISGAQRLPNGNTLIDDGTHGTFIEVTANGEVVWKYVNPVVREGALAKNAGVPTDPVRDGEWMNAVFRIYRYPLTYPGLVGKTLTPQGQLEK
jgi:hypothetical protein